MYPPRNRVFPICSFLCGRSVGPWLPVRPCNDPPVVDYRRFHRPTRGSRRSCPGCHGNDVSVCDSCSIGVNFRHNESFPGLFSVPLDGMPQRLASVPFPPLALGPRILGGPAFFSCPRARASAFFIVREWVFFFFCSHGLDIGLSLL